MGEVKTPWGAAIDYVRETDYIDDHSRNLAGEAFLSGVEWERSRASAIAESYLDKSPTRLDRDLGRINITAKRIRDEILGQPNEETKGEK